MEVPRVSLQWVDEWPDDELEATDFLENIYLHSRQEILEILCATNRENDSDSPKNSPISSKSNSVSYMLATIYMALPYFCSLANIS